MTATTEDRIITRRQGQLRSIPVKGSTEILLGILVALDSNGYAVAGADTAGYKFAGVALENVDNSDGSDGDAYVEVYQDGEFDLETQSALGIDDVGKRVYIKDNQTVGLASEVTNEVFVGFVAEVTTEETFIRLCPWLDDLEGTIDGHLDGGDNKHDASEIDVEDTGGYFTGDDVETALQEVGAVMPTADEAAGLAVNTPSAADPVLTKACFFASAEQTGTGASQDVAHGLGAVPTGVVIAVTEDPAGTGFDVAEGTHDATNVKATVTSGVKFKVLAWYAGV